MFDGRHFDREIIVLCVRWYLRYKLSLHALVELMHRTRKGQFDLSMLGLNDTAAPSVWSSVLFYKYGYLIYWINLGPTSYWHPYQRSRLLRLCNTDASVTKPIK